MDEFIVRLKGKPKEYMDSLLSKGYFSNKNEIVRHGILELANKYDIKDDYIYDKEELTKVGKVIERELRDIKKKKSKLYSEKDFLKLFPHLKDIK